jgi:GAF domain-containing protein
MDDLNSPLEIQRLRTLQETGLLTSPAPPEFETICQQVRERFQVPVAFVTLVGREKLVIKAGAGPETEATPRSDAFCDYTIRTDDVFVVPDLLTDPRFASNPLVAGGSRFRFYAGAPLVYLREIRLGSLCLLDTRPRDFSPGDRAELAELADQAVSVIARQEFGRLPQLVPR